MNNEYGTSNFAVVVIDTLQWSLVISVADINECQSSPCLNDGTCDDQINGFEQGLEGGVLIPHSRSFFARILHPALFSSLSGISFLLSQKYMKKD